MLESLLALFPSIDVMGISINALPAFLATVFVPFAVAAIKKG